MGRTMETKIKALKRVYAIWSVSKTVANAVALKDAARRLVAYERSHPMSVCLGLDRGPIVELAVKIMAAR